MMEENKERPIYSTKGGVLTENDEITKEDREVLVKAGLWSDDFDLDGGYFPKSAVEILIQSIEDDYPELTKVLPIKLVDPRTTNPETEEEAGMSIVYGYNEESDTGHTYLLVRRQLPDSDGTELFNMDPLSTDFRTESYSDKFVMGYANTPYAQKNKSEYDNYDGLKDVEKNPEFLRIYSRANDSRGILGIHMDYQNCISYAIHFAKKMYKAIAIDLKMRGIELKDCTKDDVLASFDNVMDSFGTGVDKNGKQFFMFPESMLKYGQSEEAMKIAGEEISKDKLRPYKEKREKFTEERNKELDEQLKNYDKDVSEEIQRKKAELKEKSVEITEELEESIKKEVMSKLEIKRKKQEAIDKAERDIENSKQALNAVQNWRYKDIKTLVRYCRKMLEMKKSIAPGLDVLNINEQKTKSQNIEPNLRTNPFVSPQSKTAKTIG